MAAAPENLARTLALQNAVKYKGRANPKALIGAMLAEFPDYKKKMKELMQLINETVSAVNKLSIEEQEQELRAVRPDFDKVEKKEGLKPLPNVGKRVVLRFEPSPSGPLHIGHAYTLSLNLEYTQMYKGKFYLRIADTNPGNIAMDAYDLIPQDAQWLSEGSIAETIIQSDRLELYYAYALLLLEEGHLYVCTCSSEEFKVLKDQSVACPCREISASENNERWKKMHSPDGYKAGEAVARFKTDINHKNPAMRDFPAFRINEAEHPRQGKKFRVWPLMNFSVAVDDMDIGVTHTLRGKDHADNAKKQALIHEMFSYQTPEAISVGRINFEGFPVSCSKTRERIEKGEFVDWEDPRIPFLPALRKRGYQPRALKKYAVEVGVTKNDKSVHIDEFFKHINALNKELIDPIAKRLFFIEEPEKISVAGAPAQTLELDLHPDTESGGRKFTTSSDFYIAKADAEAIKGMQRVRLMECMTITVNNGAYEFHKKEYEKEETDTIIHWLPGEAEHVKVSIMMPDGSVKRGIGEERVSYLDKGAIVQFERVGFCRFDHAEDGEYVFYYAHR